MWLSRLLERPLLKNVRDAAATIRAIIYFLAPVISAGIVAYLTWGKRLVPPEIAITVVVAIFVTSSIVVWMAYILRRRLPANAYEVLSLQSTLLVERVRDHHRYTNTKDMVIRARQGGIRLIDQRWYWTGQSSNPISVRSVFADHVIFDGVRPEPDNWVHRWVYLGRSLAKGETARVGVAYSVEDDLQPMRPFFTDGGRGYPMKSVKLAIRFPGGEEPKLVEAHVWGRRVDETELISELPVSRSVDATTMMVDYVIAIDGGQANRRYGFRWQW